MRRDATPEVMPPVEPTSYYGRPVIKEPVWKWPIAGYLFSGGLAGGSSLLAFGAALTGNPRLARTCRLTAFAALAASTGFLVEDLGRPSRFLNMLRVFKPTSPMSMGTWTLAAYGPLSGAVAVADLTGVPRRLAAPVQAVDGIAALTGIGVASYTAVLLADTSVPAWHGARRELPFVFVGSAMAAAGGAAMALNPPTVAAPAARFALLGAAVEQVAARALHRRLGEVGETYETGTAGRLSRAARLCTAAGMGLTLVGRRRRGVAALAGGLFVAGSLAERFAVFHAGKASARDPRYTVGPQRRRLEEGRPVRAEPAGGGAGDGDGAITTAPRQGHR